MGKFSFLILAAFGYGFIMGNGSSCTSKAHHFNVTPQALYNSDNELYFNNELPKSVEVVAEEAPGYPESQVIYGATSHTPGTRYYKIYISPRYNLYEEDERETVLHEMAHVYVWEQVEKGNGVYVEHGSMWQNEMLTLAKEGAFADLW